MFPDTGRINHAGRDALVLMKTGMSRDEALSRVTTAHRLSRDEYFIVKRSLEDIAEADRVREIARIGL